MRPLLVLVLVIVAIAALFIAVWFNLNGGKPQPAPTNPHVTEAPQAPTGPTTTTPLADSGPVVRAPVDRGEVRAPAGGPMTVQFDNQLTGLVKNTQHQPVAGAEVILTTYGANEIFFANDPVPDFSKEPKATTNAEGRFKFPSIEPAQAYTLIVTHKDYARKTQKTLPVLEAGESAEPEIILGPGATLTGIVKDEAGNKVPDATLYLEQQDGPMIMGVASPDRMTVKSGADGLYVFAHVSPGTRALTALAPGYGQVTLPPLVFENEGQQINRDVTLKVSEMICGRVIGPGNQGLPKATVIAIGVSSTQQSARCQVETDAKGEFCLQNLTPGEYNVIAAAEGFRAGPHPFRVNTNTSNLILEMFKEATVCGQVVDAVTGQPVPAFTVRMRFWAGAGLPTTPAPKIYPQNDPSGKFCVEGVGPGEYVVEAVAPEYAPSFSSNFTVQISKQVDNIIVKLGRGSSISGIILDPDGKPVPRARVVTRDNEWADDPFTRAIAPQFPSNVTDAEVRTGDDGRFTLKNLNPDTYQINVMAPNFTRFARRDLRILDGVELKLGDIKLQRGGTVRGTLYDAAGKPLVGGLVNVRASDGDYNEYKTKSDGNGKFVLANCAPGRYILSGTRSGNGDMNVFSEIADNKASEISIIVAEGDVTTSDVHLKD
jgi:hypothetical protein